MFLSGCQEYAKRSLHLVITKPVLSPTGCGRGTADSSRAVRLRFGMTIWGRLVNLYGCFFSLSIDMSLAQRVNSYSPSLGLLFTNFLVRAASSPR
jgi:hypothetical protein